MSRPAERAVHSFQNPAKERLNAGPFFAMLWCRIQCKMSGNRLQSRRGCLECKFFHQRELQRMKAMKEKIRTMRGAGFGTGVPDTVSQQGYGLRMACQRSGCDFRCGNHTGVILTAIYGLLRAGQ